MTTLSVREALHRGTREVTAADHPSFLWPRASFDINDTYKGFLRGPLLITVCNLFVQKFVLMATISGI